MGEEQIEIAPGITATSNVSFGKPVIKGTRISIDIVMDQLAAGSSYEEIEHAYGLTRQNILDVLGYAAEIIAQGGRRSEGPLDGPFVPRRKRPRNTR